MWTWIKMRWSAKSWRADLRVTLWIATVFVVVLYLVIVISAQLHPPRMVSAIEARTEQLSFVVDNPEFASFDVGGFRFAQTPLSNGSVCLQGRLRPTPGATMTYLMIDDAFAIRIAAPPGRPVAVIDTSPDVLPEEASLVLDHAKCRGAVKRRFAVGGATVIGNDYQGEGSPVLQSGKISLSAQSGESILGRLQREPSLYPAGSYDLPAGSRLRECMNGVGSHPSNWWGFVDVALGKDDETTFAPAMSVRLLTDARRLALALPAATGTDGNTACGGENEFSGRESVIALPLLAQITGDPALAEVSLAVGFFIIVAQLVGQIASLPRAERR